jgi:hypothetical protein
MALVSDQAVGEKDYVSLKRRIVWALKCAVDTADHLRTAAGVKLVNPSTSA